MHISAEWFGEAPYAAPEEAATACVLHLLQGNWDLTEHREPDSSETHRGLVMPAFSLAYSLARDWWLLFGSRSGSLSLRNYVMGHALPDVRLRFDGYQLETWAEATDYTNPPITFLSAPLQRSNRVDAETTIGDFIAATADRLDGAGLRDTAVQLRWRAVQEARSVPATAFFCEAAGSLRCDPFAIDEASARLIEQSASLFDGEALLDFLSGVGAMRGGEALAWIKRVEARPAYDSRLPGLKSLATTAAKLTPARPGESGWSLGYRRAQAAREALNLVDADRLCGMREIVGKLGSRAFTLAPAVNGVSALRTQRGEMEHVHLRSQGESEEARSGHGFALARAIGDAVCFPEPGRFAVNTLRDAFRPAAGRAFAAEFLAPIDEIASMREDGKDDLTIATEFGVSPQVVEHQLENEERIRLACAA